MILDPNARAATFHLASGDMVVHALESRSATREDFAAAPLGLQGLFVHELCHVWQHQRGVCLPLARHPFCRYHYTIHPGWPLERYGLEQQAEIVRHAFLLRSGVRLAGTAPLAQYLALMPQSFAGGLV